MVAEAWAVDSLGEGKARDLAGEGRVVVEEGGVGLAEGGRGVAEAWAVDSLV